MDPVTDPALNYLGHYRSNGLLTNLNQGPIKQNGLGQNLNGHKEN